ncbi:MAG: methyltransferase domain-containing protein [Candidatus Marsarchaeota archaeon]|nr:methyltransferase domain-containing protein [Candidatus Marsarchaeota archaeon]
MVFQIVEPKELDRGRISTSELQESSFFFKLFNSIKTESEVKLAEAELTSLFGKVQPVHNFAEELSTSDLHDVLNVASQRGGRSELINSITYELAYGRVQGFKGKGSLGILPKLVRRLAYTAEIYVVAKAHTQIRGQNLVRGVNLFSYSGKKSRIVRAITVQRFLDKSAYVSKLSRNAKELEINLETLLRLPRWQADRIPASETASVGRRLEDWFAIREEPSLYLAHFMHPYKGKFHPKLARALLNIVCPEDDSIVLDNFSGSGTTLLEAQWMGIQSVGVDLNPLSVLMTDVKIQSVKVGSSILRGAIDRFLLSYKKQSQVQKLVMDPHVAKRNGKIRLAEGQLTQIEMAIQTSKRLFGDARENPIRSFVILGISGAISDVSRRTQRDFSEVLAERLQKLWLRVRLEQLLARKLNLKLSNGVCYVGDARDLTRLETLDESSHSLGSGSITGILDSPPYSSALDYIKNDFPQLTLLGIGGNLEELADKMIGTRKERVSIAPKEKRDVEVPAVATRILQRLQAQGETVMANSIAQYWQDMRDALSEMERVLKPGGKAAVVVGDNNVKTRKGGRYERVPNIKVLVGISKSLGFNVISLVRRDLEKTMSGLIRDETVIILEKPPCANP